MSRVALASALHAGLGVTAAGHGAVGSFLAGAGVVVLVVALAVGVGVLVARATLRGKLGGLRHSRDELARAVARLGEALSGSLDLDRILGVILDAALESAGADAGALLLTSADGRRLHLLAGRGLATRLGRDQAPDSRNLSAVWAGPGAAGIAARVAATGEILCGPVDPWASAYPDGDELAGSGLRLAADEPTAEHVLALPLRSGDVVTGALCLYDRRDGRPFDASDVNTVRAFLSQATVAIDNVLLHQQAQRLSVTDGLTGLWNYRYATRALDREVERAHRFGRPLAVLMLDLDRFKQINDRFGHPRGDAVLVETAERIRGVVREVDILARYGGEELLLVLPETDVDGARLLAGRIREVVGGTPVPPQSAEGMVDLTEEPLHVTTSVGVAVFPVHGDSASELLHAADQALYAAKAAGRDAVRVAVRVAEQASQPVRILDVNELDRDEAETRSALPEPGGAGEVTGPAGATRWAQAARAAEGAAVDPREGRPAR